MWFGSIQCLFPATSSHYQQPQAGSMISNYFRDIFGDKWPEQCCCLSHCWRNNAKPDKRCCGISGRLQQRGPCAQAHSKSTYEISDWSPRVRVLSWYPALLLIRPSWIHDYIHSTNTELLLLCQHCTDIHRNTVKNKTSMALLRLHENIHFTDNYLIASVVSAMKRKHGEP